MSQTKPTAGAEKHVDAKQNSSLTFAVPLGASVLKSALGFQKLCAPVETETEHK